MSIATLFLTTLSIHTLTRVCSWSMIVDTCCTTKWIFFSSFVQKWDYVGSHFPRLSMNCRHAFEHDIYSFIRNLSALWQLKCFDCQFGKAGESRGLKIESDIKYMPWEWPTLTNTKYLITYEAYELGFGVWIQHYKKLGLGLQLIFVLHGNVCMICDTWTPTSRSFSQPHPY